MMADFVRLMGASASVWLRPARDPPWVSFIFPLCLEASGLHRSAAALPSRLLLWTSLRTVSPGRPLLTGPPDRPTLGPVLG